MSIKKFLAPTMEEALTDLRRNLGEHAVILRTRTVAARGFLGRFSRSMVEITATRDEQAQQEAKKRTESRLIQSRPKSSTAPGSRANSAYTKQNLLSNENGDDLESIRHEISSLHSMFRDLVRETRYPGLASLPESFLVAYHQLLELEIDEVVATRLILHLHNKLSSSSPTQTSRVFEHLEKLVRGLIPVTGPVGVSEGKPRLIAMVGPTGVGKTTTIAKLASIFRRKNNLKVALISIDTYRIAASEQIGRYGEMLGIPVEVVTQPDQIHSVLHRLSDFDLIFLDTAGRSQRDRIKMAELEDYLEIAQPDETHLVLAASSHPSGMTDIAKRFLPLGIDRLLISKIDESPSLGFLLQVILQIGKPISYLTNGRNVPEDIQVASSQLVANLCLGRESADFPSVELAT
ncbi:MAG: flagellar biosynthesis protein FlhF [Planctomycetota bacterium]|nr:flagellar biosynthesis protein FlhF [Planctomycetota bacterium]